MTDRNQIFPNGRAGVAKLFMQSTNSSTNPCRMRHKCRAGVANLFSPCAKIFRHTSIHLKMRHTNIHSFVIYLYFEVKTRPYSAVISKKKKKGHPLFRCTFSITFGLNMPPNVRPTKCGHFFFFWRCYWSDKFFGQMKGHLPKLPEKS